MSWDEFFEMGSEVSHERVFESGVEKRRAVENYVKMIRHMRTYYQNR